MLFRLFFLFWFTPPFTAPLFPSLCPTPSVYSALKYVFTEVPPTWLMGSVLCSVVGLLQNRLDLAVSSTGLALASLHRSHPCSSLSIKALPPTPNTIWSFYSTPRYREECISLSLNDTFPKQHFCRFHLGCKTFYRKF